MTVANVFTVNNFPLPATPPGYFVPDSNGWSMPVGHTSWQLLIDTTGLPTAQPFADVVVQYHYTSVQLGATGVSDQGLVTNPDGTVSSITGGVFTGWIDDCESSMTTTYSNKLGQTAHSAYMSCDLKRIIGAYPDRGRFLVKSSPGYVSVPSVSLNLT